ncbi:MAG: hypothetical protein AB7F35_28720 [Acetobacteraceae bacterium]
MRLFELDVLEARRVADLAADARRRRDELMEKVSEESLGEPPPVRGERNPSAGLDVETVLRDQREYIALRDAIGEVPRDIREKLRVVAQVGRDEITAAAADEALAAVSGESDAAILTVMMDNPDLHDHLRRGLYLLHAASVPGDKMTP